MREEVFKEEEEFGWKGSERSGHVESYSSMWNVKRRCTCEKKRMKKMKGAKHKEHWVRRADIQVDESRLRGKKGRGSKTTRNICECCLGVCVSHKHKHTHSFNIFPSITSKAIYLSIWLVCSLNNGANMKRVTEKIRSSDGGHRVSALRAAQGINSGHKGITRGSHLHFTLTTKVETTRDCSCRDHHNSYQICF